MPCGIKTFPLFLRVEEGPIYPFESLQLLNCFSLLFLCSAWFLWFLSPGTFVSLARKICSKSRVGIYPPEVVLRRKLFINQTWDSGSFNSVCEAFLPAAVLARTQLTFFPYSALILSCLIFPVIFKHWDASLSYPWSVLDFYWIWLS